MISGTEASDKGFIASLGQGATAGAMSRLDWSATPLGPITQWPGHLKTAVALVARSPAAMALLWGEAGTLIYNDAYAVICGSKHPGALGQPIGEVWPEQADFNQRMLRGALAGETFSFHDELLPIVREGRLADAWFDLDYSPVFDGHGCTVGVIAIVLETTQRMMASRDAEDSANQFRSFAQSLPNHVWTSDTAGRLDWVNDRVFAYVGAGPSKDDLYRGGWASVLHTDDQVAAGERWRASLATGTDYEAEFRIRRFDGVYRWHLVRGLPLRTADGQISRWIGTNTDIHERKLAQVETLRDRDRMWTLSQELMLVCDFEGTIRSVNPSATRMLGWQPEEMIGQALGSFLHPDDMASTAAEVGKLADGITTLLFENRYRRRDGSYRLLSWTAVPDGRLIHAVARDISRERAAEEALRQSQKLEAIGQLTGGVAHDFNNVLAVIRTSIDLLRRLQLTDDRRGRFMEAISNAVTRATKLTGQLLAFARRQALQPIVFDAGQNARAVSEMIASLTGARIAIELDLADEACFVNADPSQFDTALVNLSVNARDAMGGSGCLTIAVREASEIPAIRSHPAVPGHFVAVSIADTGIGIAAENITQIFEPFFTTKGTGHGTGLGLSQVFGFAKQSGGDIQVTSTLGVGSRFTLYLPRAPRPGAAAMAAMADSHDRELKRGDGGCILLVEDNLEVSASVQETLRELGYSTVVVGSAEQALRELESDAARFVAVFSDVVMSGMSGVELGHEIRRRFGALPIILSSGYSYVLAQRPDHGFALLPKPYSLDDLARALHDTITRGAPAANTARLRPSSRLAGVHPALSPEAERLREAELDRLQIMDTEEEVAYDELTRLAATYCNTPIALISLVDGERQWFKSRVGLQARETPREHAFCAFAIEEPDRVMVVGDATKDSRFATNPLVTGDPNIRFYAGAPLVTANGHALGTICVIDREPRELEPKQVEMLQFLANQIIQRLEERRAAREKMAGRVELR